MFKTLTADYNKITANRLIIWQFPINILFKDADKFLSTEEKEKASGFYYDYHRIRYIVSHAITRVILAKYVNIAPQDLIFATQKRGKPYLTNALEVEFNLSHSNDLALLAIGKSHPVGIDIEFSKSRNFEGISNMMYSPNEHKIVKTTSSNLQSQIFFNIWAQKEAVIKADGAGIYQDTKSFDVSVTANNYPIFAFDKDWIIKTFSPQPLYYAALCHNPQVNEIFYQTINDSCEFYANITG